MTYVALRPRLLFSYPGKPPVLTGSREINELGQDDAKGWRYLFELCGGDGKATKRIIEATLKPHVGPCDWGDADLDKPLNLGTFFNEVAKLQTGQRWAILYWAHAKSQGHEFQVDQKSVMVSRERFVPENTTQSVAEAQAKAKAQYLACEIENSQIFNAAVARAEAENTRIMQEAAAYEKNRKRVTPVYAQFKEPEMGRSRLDMVNWKRLFEFIDMNETNTVSKYQIQSKLAPLLGAFDWADDQDTTPMTFSEFLNVMCALPTEKRFMTLIWARDTCPQRVYSMDGVTRTYCRDGEVFATHTIAA